MDNSLQKYIDILKDFSVEKNEVVELILTGGLALSVYGIPSYTIDIDGEVTTKNYYELVEYLKMRGISFDLSDNISAWGVVPLPKGYRERSKIVYEDKHLIIKTLEPVDFVLSKIGRGLEEDLDDVVKVIKKYNLTEDMIRERTSLITYPKDLQTWFFKKNLEYLFSRLGKDLS